MKIALLLLAAAVSGAASLEGGGPLPVERGPSVVKSSAIATWRGGAAAPQRTIFSSAHSDASPQVRSMEPDSFEALIPGATNNYPETLTLNGDHFYPGAVVLWRKRFLTTTFVSRHQLRARLGRGAFEPETFIPNTGGSATVDIPVRVLNANGHRSGSRPFRYTCTIVGG